MNKLFFVTAILVCHFAWAQQEKLVGDFDTLKVFDQINVELIPAATNKVVLIGENANDVELVNKNGELKIRLSLDKMLKGEEISAKVYFKSIHQIDANEGSTVSCNSVFKQTALEINAKESSEVNLKLDVQKAKIRAVTSGRIKISGKSVNQDASIGTSGILEARDFKTMQSTVAISAGGEADIFASEFVDAQVNMGGTITIFGKPKQINQKTRLGGSITQAQ